MIAPTASRTPRSTLHLARRRVTIQCLSRRVMENRSKIRMTHEIRVQSVMEDFPAEKREMSNQDLI